MDYCGVWLQLQISLFIHDTYLNLSIILNRIHKQTSLSYDNPLKINISPDAVAEEEDDVEETEAESSTKEGADPAREDDTDVKDEL